MLPAKEQYRGKEMKALTLDHPGLTREALLCIADRTPGAWIGIRIAVLLLILAGWKSAQCSRAFRFNPLDGSEMDSEGKQGRSRGGT